jgi:hypothetical protein
MSAARLRSAFVPHDLTAPVAVAAAAAAAAAASEQRAGRCDQQCRYGGYCKKLGYPRHDDLPFVFNSASKPGNATRPDQVPSFVHAPS